MKKARLPVCRMCLKLLISTPRFWAVCVILFLYLESIFAPIRDMLVECNMTIGLLGLLTFLLNDTTASALITVLFLAMMFDVPATDELQRYYLLRTGKREWAHGQLLYVFAAAVLFLLIVVVMVQGLILPWSEQTLDWSRGIRAFTDDFMYEVYDSMLLYDPWLTKVYTPIAACMLELGLHLIVMVMLGFALMNLNARVDRRVGFAVLVLPLMVESLLEEYFGLTLSYVSPLTWARLSGLDYQDGLGRPPILYAAGVSLAVSALLYGLFLHTVKRKELIS